jgi:hypothetical protein
MASTPTPMKKKLINRAPLKRTFHFFVHVTDEAGNPIQGAKLKVDRIMSDARKVVEFLDSPEYLNSGLTRIKHEVVTDRRNGGEGATQAG